MITELNERAQTVLRHIIDTYMTTGDPVGSRSIAKELDLNLSPATIRNVMSDLEAAGLLYAPHTSAGRLPTQQGMRLYVDGLMEIGDLSDAERKAIEAQCHAAGQSMNTLLDRATTMLSGLSAAASLVVAPKTDKPIRQVQFIRVDINQVLAVLVMQDNMIENRIMEIDSDVSESALIAAANYLNDRLAGKSLRQAQTDILKEITEQRSQLDTITADLVKRGLALTPQGNIDGHLIIRGQSKLLQDVKALEDLEKARQLLAALEEQETMAKLLESTHDADGIQIFIGTENRMFDHSGWSMVISPYKTGENKIVGAIGVIGPVRLNYGRIIPVVDYTAKVMGRLIGS